MLTDGVAAAAQRGGRAVEVTDVADVLLRAVRPPAPAVPNLEPEGAQP
jgi:hypothetical protein